MCQALLGRTNLQLKGAAAENLDQQTPLDIVGEPFNSELQTLVEEHTCAHKQTPALTPRAILTYR